MQCEPEDRSGLCGLVSEMVQRGAGSYSSRDLVAVQDNLGIDYVGFVEGSDIGGHRADVIVTDGFTGNVALKTGEGVARFIQNAMRHAFRANILSRLGAMVAYPAIRAMAKKMDPRLSNGGVFLGLGGTVIKSHGGSDSVAMGSAIRMAFTLADSGFNERLNNRLQKALETSSQE